MHRRVLEGWAYGWAHATELSAGRVQPDDARAMADRQADAMLFVLALSKLEMCVVALLGPDHAEVAEFRTRVGGLKDARDMLEHFDEYVTGQGRLQRDGIIDKFGVLFSGDQQSLTIAVAGIVIRVPDAFDAGMRLLRVAFGGTSDDEADEPAHAGRDERPP